MVTFSLIRQPAGAVENAYRNPTAERIRLPPGNKICSNLYWLLRGGIR